MLISIVSWLVLGLLCGFIASTLMNKRGEGLSVDIVLGIIGAVVGGWFFKAIGVAGIWSIVVAVAGAAFVLGVFHVIKGSTIRA